MMNLTKITGCALMALAFSTVTATAAVYEGFEGLTVDASLNGQGAGTGWSGTWSTQDRDVTVRSGGLSYANGDVSHDGGDRHIEVNITPAASGATDKLRGVFARNLGSSIALEPGAVWYISFLTQIDSQTADHFEPIVAVGNPGSGNRLSGAGIVGSTWTDAQSGAYIGESSNTGPNVAENVTHLLVAKISAEVDPGDSTLKFFRSELFLNPDSTTEPATPDATKTKFNGSTADVQEIYSFVKVGDGNGGLWLVDDIRVGTSYSDVVVPEPASLALLGLGGLLAIGRRR